MEWIGELLCQRVHIQLNIWTLKKDFFESSFGELIQIITREDIDLSDETAARTALEEIERVTKELEELDCINGDLTNSWVRDINNYLEGSYAGNDVQCYYSDSYQNKNCYGHDIFTESGSYNTDNEHKFGCYDISGCSSWAECVQNFSDSCWWDEHYQYQDDSDTILESNQIYVTYYSPFGSKKGYKCMEKTKDVLDGSFLDMIAFNWYFNFW
eukprot:UN24072